MQDKFIERYNDYDCIYENCEDNIEQVCHYTSHIDAAINISKGCFRATNMSDFDDGLEGQLILKRTRELLDKSTIYDFTNLQREYIDGFIGNDDKILDFINNNTTNVVSTCMKLNSSYMWENYAKEKGYCIIFDRKKLIDSLWFETKNREKKTGKYIK